MCVTLCSHCVRHCAHTVYVTVLTLCTSLCSHCVCHCVHTVYVIVLTQVYSDPVTIEELAIAHVTKETNTVGSSIN